MGEGGGCRAPTRTRQRQETELQARGPAPTPSPAAGCGPEPTSLCPSPGSVSNAPPRGCTRSAVSSCVSSNTQTHLSVEVHYLNLTRVTLL